MIWIGVEIGKESWKCNLLDLFDKFSNNILDGVGGGCLGKKTNITFPPQLLGKEKQTPYSSSSRIFAVLLAHAPTIMCRGTRLCTQENKS